MKKTVFIVLISLLVLGSVSAWGLLKYRTAKENDQSLKNTEILTGTEEAPPTLSENGTQPVSTEPVELTYMVKKLKLSKNTGYRIMLFEMFYLEYGKNHSTPDCNFTALPSEWGYEGALKYPRREDVVLPDFESLPEDYLYDSSKLVSDPFSSYNYYWLSVFSSSKGETYNISLIQRMHSLSIRLTYSERITAYLVKTDKFNGIILEYGYSTDNQGGIPVARSLFLDDGKFTYWLSGIDVPMDELIKMAYSMDLCPPREYYWEPNL